MDKAGRMKRIAEAALFPLESTANLLLSRYKGRSLVLSLLSVKILCIVICAIEEFAIQMDIGLDSPRLVSSAHGKLSSCMDRNGPKPEA
jgi:hypothetical protein